MTPREMHEAELKRFEPPPPQKVGEPWNPKIAAIIHDSEYHKLHVDSVVKVGFATGIPSRQMEALPVKILTMQGEPSRATFTGTIEEAPKYIAPGILKPGQIVSFERVHIIEIVQG